jgi:hypothetical protein
MNYNFGLTASLIIIIFIGSCGNPSLPENKKEIFRNRIEFNPKEASLDSLQLSEIASRVEYIPLQTDKGKLLGDFGNLAITEKYFFLNMGGSILEYDNEGRFIRDLFKTGRGPGEVFARSYSIDRIGERVYVYSNFEHFIKEYDFGGKYIKTIRNQINDPTHWTKEVFFFNNSLVVVTYQNQESKYLLSSFDLSTGKNRILYKDYSHDSTRKINPRLIQPLDAINYQLFDSVFLYKEMFCDTIFKVMNTFKIKPIYIVDFGNQRIKREDLINMNYGDRAKPFGYRINSFAETNSFLFLLLGSYRDDIVFVVQNKRGNSIKMILDRISKFAYSNAYFKNDLDGIVDFNPLTSQGKIIYYNECLYSIVDANRFSKAYHSASIKSKNSSEYLIKMAPIFNSIDEFSNPIIMKVYLK